MNNPKSIHLVGTGDAVAELKSAIQAATTIPIQQYHDAEEFLESLRESEVRDGWVVIGRHLRGMGRMALVKQLSRKKLDCRVFVLTDDTNMAIRAIAQKFGVKDVVDKSLIARYVLDELRAVSVEAPLDKH